MVPNDLWGFMSSHRRARLDSDLSSYLNQPESSWSVWLNLKHAANSIKSRGSFACLLLQMYCGIMKPGESINTMCIYPKTLFCKDLWRLKEAMHKAFTLWNLPPPNFPLNTEETMLRFCSLLYGTDLVCFTQFLWDKHKKMQVHDHYNGSCILEFIPM